MQDHAIERLIQSMARLPGLGPRSARRLVLHLIKHRETMMLPLAEALKHAASSIVSCGICGNLDSVSPCHICEQPRRDRTTICVVEDVADLWAIERSRIYQGLYHVLGGTLSALEGRGPEDLAIDALIARVKAEDTISEVILATNATLDGQTTAHYLIEKLRPFPIAVSRLAYGIPMGSELDYLDDGTLGAALKSRQSLQAT